MDYLKLKQKYEKNLAWLNDNIHSYKMSNNQELKIAATTLEKKKEEVELILNAINAQIAKDTNIVMNNENKFVFTLWKCYEHTTGTQMKIVGIANTTVYGDCLIGELPTGELIPVGRQEDNTVNYKEIPEEEWMKNFS